MRLVLFRRWREGDATIGTLFVDGRLECFTLEDVVRTVGPAVPDAEEIGRVKVAGATAIPAGRYRVSMVDSPHFGRVPTLHDVPGFSLIRIHAGNTAADTRGCILVGRRRVAAAIVESRAALEALVAKVEAAVAGGGAVSIEILDGVVA